MSERKSEKRHLGIARRADLPTSGEIRGRITVIQEDRFRLEDEDGRGYLFIVGRRSGVSMTDLKQWNQGRTPVTVRYEGAPDLGATAEAIRV